jgi:hypothetical protein
MRKILVFTLLLTSFTLAWCWNIKNDKSTTNNADGWQKIENSSLGWTAVKKGTVSTWTLEVK